MAENTPGPWEVAGLWVCEANDPGHNAGICMCEDRPEADANAHLISAAPDMLAALKEALELLTWKFGNKATKDSVIGECRAAIAKAEGALASAKRGMPEE